MHYKFFKKFILCFWALLSMLLFSCKNDLDKIRVDEGEKIPVAVTRDFISLYSDSGKVVLKIEAPLRKDYVAEDFYSELPEGINMTFFDVNKKILANLTADYALIKGSGMFMKGSVEMESAQNGTLKTESLVWDSEKKEITTSDAIEIRQKNKVLFGLGIWAKQDFSEYHIMVPTGTFPISDR